MHLSELWIYPVKSCQGIRVDRARIVDTGLEHDRMWMVVDEHGKFVTQRQYPSMATIEAHPEASGVMLAAPGQESMWVDGPEQTRLRVSIWEHECDALDAGDPVAEWLSDFLHAAVRLVRMPAEHQRPVGSAYDGQAQTSFSDGYPILAISTASLADLNRRLDTPVPADRFRPNFVIDGTESHAEDHWERILVGSVPFLACKPCPRCVITTIDQQTGAKGKEPLRTLAGYRRDERGVLFGQNLVHLGRGQVRVGDAVQPTRHRNWNPDSIRS